MKDLDCIRLRKLSFRGRHGAISEEKDFGQRLMVDADLYGDFSQACESDELSKAVDYTAVCKTVLEIAESASCHLLERLAARIADGVLKRFPLQRVRIVLSKEPGGVCGMPELLSVVITRERER